MQSELSKECIVSVLLTIDYTSKPIGQAWLQSLQSLQLSGTALMVKEGILINRDILLAMFRKTA
jgi:hypothetical protein